MWYFHLLRNSCSPAVRALGKSLIRNSKSSCEDWKSRYICSLEKMLVLLACSFQISFNQYLCSFSCSLCHEIYEISKKGPWQLFFICLSFVPPLSLLGGLGGCDITNSSTVSWQIPLPTGGLCLFSFGGGWFEKEALVKQILRTVL